MPGPNREIFTLAILTAAMSAAGIVIVAVHWSEVYPNAFVDMLDYVNGLLSAVML